MKIIALVALIIPSRAYGGAGFSDDGASIVLLVGVGIVLLVGVTMALFTVIATGALAVRWLSRGGASRTLVWGAACFPLSVVLGIVVVAQSGPFGIGASLTDPSTYFFGCVYGGFFCVLALPAVLVTAFLNSRVDDSRLRAGPESTSSDRDSS